MAVAKSLCRILDANFNRAKEGLRVCEDVCRFFWNKPVLSRAFKSLRHDLHDTIVPLGIHALIAERDIENDVGRATSKTELKRLHMEDVFWANSQRVKESLRVLEELTKLADPAVSEAVKQLRYRVYALEQKAYQRR